MSPNQSQPGFHDPEDQPQRAAPAPAALTQLTLAVSTLPTDFRQRVCHVGEDGFEQEEAGVGEAPRGCCSSPGDRELGQTHGRSHRGAHRPGTQSQMSVTREQSQAAQEDSPPWPGLGVQFWTSEGTSTAQGPPENASLSGRHSSKGVLFPGTFRSKDVVLRL